MNKFIAVLVLVSLFFSVFSQEKKEDKDLQKIEKLYQKEKFSKCISKSENYLYDNKKSAKAYFYIGFSYFGEYKKSEDLKREKILKLAVKKVMKGIKYDSADEDLNIFSKENKEMHDSLRVLAYRLYNQKKNRSREYFKLLVKLYSDTTEEYRAFYPPKKLTLNEEIVVQMNKGLLNMKDANGLKQGHWKKAYPSGTLAYDVTFVDNKPVGELKRYHETGELRALLIYVPENDTVKATLYNEVGKKVAEGQYIGKKKEGTWRYFNKGILVKEENYKNDKFHGRQLIFYPNGQIYDEKIFENGVENGVWKRFYEDGAKKSVVHIKNNKVDGLLMRFHQNGRLETKGMYENGLREGKWESYSVDGEKDITNYTHGKPDNYKELEAKENQELKDMEKNRGKLLDPADFRTRPDEYKERTQGHK